MSWFRIYISISLLVIIILLGALVGALFYAGQKIKNETQTVTVKVDNFNRSLNQVNANLTNINQTLKNDTSRLNGVSLPSTIP